MEHDESIRTHAAERYALQEMSPEERDEYEAHFFTCEICAEEVSAAAAFADNARAVLPRRTARAAEPRRLERPAAATIQSGGWRERFFGSQTPWLVPAFSAAAVLLLAVAGYQSLVVIPGLRQELRVRDAAQAVPTVALRTAARGAGPRLLVGPSDTYAVLQADVVPERPVSRYAASLTDSGGAERFRTSLAAPELGMPVTLLVPVRDLPAGDYTLVVRSGDSAGGEIGRFVFTLERQ